jgi:D-beta-D-heptose 7-phosphate kinase/D-beta-D-heptose 1-phosphate adenosyltransferase
VQFKSAEYRLGGACNVAANIKALGGEPVVVGITGEDESAETLIDEMAHAGIARQIAMTDKRRTVHKTRITANNQQIVRLDKETPGAISAALDIALGLRIEEACREAPDAIIVSDYAKGVVTLGLLNTVKRLSHDYGIPVFVDPKIPNALIYREAAWCGTVCTPNMHEAEGISGETGNEGWNRANTYFQEVLGCYWVLITRGEYGMSLFDLSSRTDIPTAAQAVFDVSGAGDTVIATLALAYASGFTMLEAAKLANLAAGIVVGKRGTAVVTREELSERVAA